MAGITFNSFSDEELVGLYLKGSSACLSLLYERFFSKVYNKCYNFTKDRDDAFDYAQEILMKAFDKLNTFKGTSKVSTWIYAITLNYCIENFRRKNNIIFEPIGEKFNISDCSENNYSDQIDTAEQELHFILGEIPDSDRIMLELKYSKNYSIKELQDSFQLSASAVKMRLQRARQKIEKKYLRHHNAAFA